MSVLILPNFMFVFLSGKYSNIREHAYLVCTDSAVQNGFFYITMHSSPSNEVTSEELSGT
jgi:hypothetical protein